MDFTMGQKLNILTRKIPQNGSKTYQKKRISDILVKPIVILKISNPEVLPKYWPNPKKVRKHAPQKVAIPLLIVCFGPMLCFFSGQKFIFKIFRFFPIVRSLISLYKLNTRGAGPIFFQRL